MKIRPLTPEEYPKASALLQQAFPRSRYKIQLIEKLRQNNKIMHEWVCVHRNTVVAYVAFTRAFDGTKVCGLHLAPLAVKPQMQNQGVGSELLRFALRQDGIRESTIFVMGDSKFFRKFGFEHCASPLCPFDKNNAHFLSMRNTSSHQYTVGYEQEFKTGK